MDLLPGILCGFAALLNIPQLLKDRKTKFRKKWREAGI